MSTPHRYAEILLPLPLEQTYTYRLTDVQAAAARPGMRAIVPLGGKQAYTGLILALSPALPTGLEEAKVRDVIRLADERPVVRPGQVELWRWMADYYLCAMGDVMNAALPAGLKPEDDDAEREERPREVPAVRVAFGRDDEEARAGDGTLGNDTRLARAFESLRRAERQQAVFMKLLDLSRYLQQAEPERVLQADLLAAVGCDATPLRELRKKGLVEIYSVPAPPSAHVLAAEPADDAEPAARLAPLSDVQQTALSEIRTAWNDRQVTLLHGVTSSGKTEIYMHLAAEAIARGEQVLMMVPEIALTTQLCRRLGRVFGHRMTVYHSKLTDRERVAVWRSLLGPDADEAKRPEPADTEAADAETAAEPGLILGVRSSLLLPFRRLGLVIVDEEHEPSYKQQDPAPRYHGRDAAIMLARLHGARVLLGSATPALETYWLAQQGKYGLVRLAVRHAGVGLPRIRLLPTLAERKAGHMEGAFSQALLQAVGRTLRAGRQVILFQNRRGYAPTAECPACAWTPRCPRCDVTLTWHRAERRMQCHYCGLTTPWPAQCPTCGSTHIEVQGYGTERIEEAIARLLPAARTARLDTDATASRRSYERILADFEAGRTNVLIGTQMVSKGLDFSAVDTVGILSADALMSTPDFRAHERAYQLMEQVSGRAGRRAGQEGEVLIQCSDPEVALLRHVVRHDYEAMAAAELADRRAHGYPPFTRLIAVYMKCRWEDRLERLAALYGAALRRVFGPQRVLGPEAPAVAWVKNLHIRKLLLKVEREAPAADVRRCLRAVQRQMQAESDDFARITFYYDADPM